MFFVCSVFIYDSTPYVFFCVSYLIPRSPLRNPIVRTNKRLPRFLLFRVSGTFVWFLCGALGSGNYEPNCRAKIMKKTFCNVGEWRCSKRWSACERKRQIKQSKYTSICLQDMSLDDHKDSFVRSHTCSPNSNFSSVNYFSFTLFLNSVFLVGKLLNHKCFLAGN